MTKLQAFWRARTARERFIIRAAAALVLAVLLPAWCYIAAAEFRTRAAADRNSAEALTAQVARLKTIRSSQQAQFGVDGPLRERVLESAEAGGLAISSLEDAGADRLRVTFEGVDSNAVYRWMDAAGQRGAAISQSRITRVADSDLVNASFDIAERR